MLSLAEIANGVRGALRLLQFDPAGAGYYDNSREAFWRSFRVMFLVAPIYALIRYLDLRGYSWTVSEPELLLVEALYYTIEWFLYPVAAYEVARVGKLGGSYLRYITALNWGSVPVVLILLALTLLGDLLPALGDSLTIATRLLLFVWFVAVTRLTFTASWGMIIALYVFNFCTSLVLGVYIFRLLGLERI